MTTKLTDDEALLERLYSVCDARPSEMRAALAMIRAHDAAKQASPKQAAQPVGQIVGTRHTGNELEFWGYFDANYVNTGKKLTVYASPPPPAAQAPQNNPDLFDDIITNIKFKPLSRSEQYAQLRRLFHETP